MIHPFFYLKYFYLVFLINFGEVSGAQIRQIRKANSKTTAQTSMARLAPPTSVKMGNKKVPAAAPIRLMVIQVPTPVARTLISNNSVGYE